ncbi:hypothetical protein SUGI_0639040 [Cryptomeria japonica]|nr:hypothetical protein SUGI_0639040 [Cryptomeria japonica]
MSAGSSKIFEKDQKKKFKDSDELHLRSGYLKAVQRAGSNPVLACMPKTASIISAYQMVPLSPGRDFACRTNRPGGIKCQISLIPREAMEKKNDHGFEPQEPTSPKVSCIGQVKKKKQACKEKHRQRKSQDRPPLPSQMKTLELGPRGAKLSKLKSFFSSKKVTETAYFCESPEADLKNSPSLGRMKRFTSGRDCDALANVWRDSQKLEERCSDETNDAKISPLVLYSGPLIIESKDQKPKPEINLWKRRSVAPPMALNLCTSNGLETRLPLTT